MDTAPENSSNTPESAPQDRTLDNIVMALNRGEALLKIVGDFSTAALQKLEVFGLSQLTNPDTLTAMDLYDRPLKEVRELLHSTNIHCHNFKKVTEQEAHTLKNFGSMAWKVPPNSKVELLTHQDRVIGIRLLGEQKP